MSFESVEVPNPFNSPQSSSVEASSPTNTQPTKIEQARQKFEKGLEVVNNPHSTYDEKFNTLIQLNTLILPFAFQELSAQIPNPDRSVIASRICTALKDATSILMKKRETELTEEINPDSPKFQKSFEWFIEVVRASMEEAGVDSTTMNNVFNVMSNRLQGWEQMILKSLKGVSSKALSEVENPFIKDFIAKTKGEVIVDSSSPKNPTVITSPSVLN